jgi:hypothetical protein
MATLRGPYDKGALLIELCEPCEATWRGWLLSSTAEFIIIGGCKLYAADGWYGMV